MTDSSNRTTWVYTSKLESTFRKVRDVQEFVRRYAPRQTGHRVSVEDIQWAVEEKYGLKINKELVDFEAVHVRGMLERYENNQANVMVRERQDPDPKLNGYWHRFISVKEIIHLAIDEKEDWNTNGAETIDDLIKNQARDEGTNAAKHEIQSEVLAEIAAFELVYPFEYRQRDIDKGTPFLELAHTYEVPEYVIQRALSTHHMKRARALWNEIGGHGLGGVGSEPQTK